MCEHNEQAKQARITRELHVKKTQVMEWPLLGLTDSAAPQTPPYIIMSIVQVGWT